MHVLAARRNRGRGGMAAAARQRVVFATRLWLSSTREISGKNSGQQGQQEVFVQGLDDGKAGDFEDGWNWAAI